MDNKQLIVTLLCHFLVSSSYVSLFSKCTNRSSIYTQATLQQKSKVIFNHTHVSSIFSCMINSCHSRSLLPTLTLCNSAVDTYLINNITFYLVINRPTINQPNIPHEPNISAHNLACFEIVY